MNKYVDEMKMTCDMIFSSTNTHPRTKHRPELTEVISGTLKSQGNILRFN